ncbi:MAG TPA: alpha/beta hydrolase [Planctomycetota bacterium]|nr:alpha/beta hydrolase [Planctomycetota bacterium]
MHQERIVEDRVFGLEQKIPPPPPPFFPSTAFDLCSTSVEGADVAYALQGTVNHPPLVMLHGWGASHKFWRCALSGFAPRYRCYAPDLVGFGLSEKPRRDYSLDAYVAWLEALLDRLKLPRVTLMGHSMGATIALLFALRRPERVEKLVLSNPVVRGDALAPKVKMMMWPGVRQMLFLLRSRPRLRRWIGMDFTSIAPLPQDLLDDIVHPTYASAVESYRSLRQVDLAEAAKGLSVPTLAVGTDQDRLLAADQIELLPTARRERIVECGHVPMIERPAEFNRLVDGFLRSP